MKSAVQNGKLGREEELSALQRLDAELRRVEAFAKGPSFEAFMERERTNSPHIGGRSVFGWEEALKKGRAR